jgi:succinate dehydrogenase / fumarate reductase flavoprotein subunit
VATLAGPSAGIDTADVDTPVSPGALGPDEGEAVADGGPAEADGSQASDGDARADGGAVAVGAEETAERALEAERQRVDRLLNGDGDRRHAEIRSKLQKAMTRKVNVFRNEDGLKQALRDVRAAREDYADVGVSDPSSTFNTDLIHTIETRNLIDLAEAITLSALARTEFRGAHWREGYQERDDENWIRHTMLSWNEGTPELYYTPVDLQGENEEYEPQIRSY